ncbi:MAG: MFS transporter [Pseudomonadales bacterium]|nr:MFS transporter [Pseudomonadales bacterium]
MSNQFSLLTRRRFLPFFLTQFFGAFNDNVFKQSLIILLAFQASSWTTLSVSVLTNLCAGLFILPFFLFSASAGQLADRYEKTRVIRAIKTIEVGIMGLACWGFLGHHLTLLLLALFLMGTHSTFFGPVKYAILPQVLHKDELIGGNALVETGTSLAILLGSTLGGLLIAQNSAGLERVCLTLLAVALTGLACSWQVPRVGVLDRQVHLDLNPWRESVRTLRYVAQQRTLFLAIMGISWFWFYGATFLTQIPAFTHHTLHANEHGVTLLLTLFSVGIALGSLLCERLSGHQVEIGLVPLGAIGLTVFGFDLYLSTRHLHASGPLQGLHGLILHYPRVLLDLTFIGVFGGFYIVPLYALIQSRSEPEHRSRVIAANNILNALFMVASALLAVLFLSVFSLSIPELFLGTAILSAAVSLYIYSLAPEYLMRFLIWILMSLFYRIERKGTEHLPEQGACILVCNHVSFYDALIIASTLRRPPRFIMDYRIFQTPLLGFIFRTARAIPIARKEEDPLILEAAYHTIQQALEAGDMICLFPEGALTKDGQMAPFRSGISRILQTSPVPVIPMALRGLWGSVASRKGGAAFSHRPRRFRSPVEVIMGRAMAPESVTPERLQDEVQRLRGDWL